METGSTHAAAVGRAARQPNMQPRVGQCAPRAAATLEGLRKNQKRRLSLQFNPLIS